VKLSWQWKLDLSSFLQSLRFITCMNEFGPVVGYDLTLQVCRKLSRAYCKTQTQHLFSISYHVCFPLSCSKQFYISLCWKKIYNNIIKTKSDYIYPCCVSTPFFSSSSKCTKVFPTGKNSLRCSHACSNVFSALLLIASFSSIVRSAMYLAGFPPHF